MADELVPTPPEGQILVYTDGGLNIQVRLDGQTVWLPQRLMADLFQVSVKTVNEHLVNIYDEGELNPGATIRKFRIVQTEGARQVSRLVDHYNLDAILAVGYRVRSLVGTAFRQWATARLSELLVKGFTMDDERLKAGARSATTTSRNSLPASATSVLRSGCSTRKFSTSTPRASTTIPKLGHRNSSFKRCRTRCTGPRTATPPPR